MICNIGRRDRIVRLILGLAILVLFSNLGPIFWVVGLYLLVTGYLRWCPLYTPFKRNTNPH